MWNNMRFLSTCYNVAAYPLLTMLIFEHLIPIKLDWLLKKACLSNVIKQFLNLSLSHTSWIFLINENALYYLNILSENILYDYSIDNYFVGVILW